MVLGFFKIAGHSMQPTILEGQKVLVSSIPYFFSKPKIDDIIAFRINSKIFVKRIYSVSDNKYHVKGDNSDDSLDSKNFGFVSKNNMLGKIIFYIS